MKDLMLKSTEARKIILEMKYKSKSSHIGSAYSILDILIYLYFKEMNINEKNKNNSFRDRLILSKGHASAALYTTLYLKGFLEKDYMEKYYCDNGKLPGHIDKTVCEFLDLSSGSLGHGLSVAGGLVLASKISEKDNKIFVILGDGELEEGSIWEAAIFISKYQFKNLTIIIDSNKFQGYDKSENLFEYKKMINMWKGLDFEVLEINGHSFIEIEKAIKYKSNKTKVIVANTVKGKGISFMENKLEWHYKSPNLDEYNKGMEELKSYENNIY